VLGQNLLKLAHHLHEKAKLARTTGKNETMSQNNNLHDNVLHQRTLRGWISVGGIGLHTGQRVELSFGPASAGSGIVFERSDLHGNPRVTAGPKSVVSSSFCTVLGNDGTRVSTVEHLLAAFFGLGVDNARVVLDGEEVPILDGSSQPFVELIKIAGIRSQAACRSLTRVTRPVEVSDGDRYFALIPARTLSIDCRVDFNHPLVSDQNFSYRHAAGAFERKLAPARTFGFLKDVGEMKRNGLARGGSLDNAVVIDSFSVLNPGGLRFPDEFVRHKTLDIMGDLALLGGLLTARVVARKSGHCLHHALMRKLVDDPDCCERIEIAPGDYESDLPFDLDPFRLAGLQGA